MGSLNKNLVTGENILQAISDTPERIINDDITINGNNEGISSLAEYSSPLVIPFDEAAELKSIKTITDKQNTVIKTVRNFIRKTVPIASPVKIYAQSDFYIFKSIKLITIPKGW